MKNLSHGTRTVFTCFSVIFMVCFHLCAITYAATWYVKPSAEIPLRRGQGSEYKVIAVLADGTPINLISEDDKWAQVRLESGKEGWVLKRYLSREKPYKAQITSLQAENAALRETLATTREKLQALTDLHQKTADELSTTIAASEAIRADYTKLQEETKNVVETKQSLLLAKKQLAQLKKRIAELELENTGLKKSSALIWFLAGSGVLFLGLIIGLISGARNRRRRSLL